VQYPVEVGIPFAARAEDGSPAEAGNSTGRQAANAAFKHRRRFIIGASQRWRTGGARTLHRQLSSRCSDQLIAVISSTASVEDAVPREIESYAGSVAGGREVLVVAEDSSSGLAG